jgi:sulfonate transport system substrate-binding protein
MPHASKSGPRIVTAVLLVLVATLTGCAQKEASLASISSDPVPTKVPSGTELVFADQNEETQTLMRASGQQEKLASDTSYANFLGGPEILEAIRGDAVDLAYVGDTPPIQAQASGELVPIVAALRTSAPDYQLAVRRGLDINTLEQLKGRKIAFAEGTGRQPFVLRALEKAGLTQQQVELVPLDVENFPDAIETGQVDVAPLNEPHFTRYIGLKGASAVPGDQLTGLSNGLHYLYVRGGALADDAKAAAIRDFVQRWLAAHQWALDNPKQWVQAYHVDTQQLSAAEGLSVVKAQGEVTFPPLDRTLFALQQDTVDVIYRSGALPEKLDARKEFVTKFDPALEAAAERVGASRAAR